MCFYTLLHMLPRMLAVVQLSVALLDSLAKAFSSCGIVLELVPVRDST